MIKTTTTIKVNYYETDKMGVVHHSNYIRYFETARTDFMEKIGLDYSRLEKEGIMSPVLSVECNYKKSCTFGDTIDVECYIKEHKGARTFFAYNIYKDGEIIVTGQTSHTFIDENFVPLNIKKKHPDIYDKLLKAIK